MAIWRRGKPDALADHSDRGSQYSSEQFQRLMADHGVRLFDEPLGNVCSTTSSASTMRDGDTRRSVI
jgi:putative transposase